MDVQYLRKAVFECRLCRFSRCVKILDKIDAGQCFCFGLFIKFKKVSQCHFIATVFPLYVKSAFICSQPSICKKKKIVKLFLKIKYIFHIKEHFNGRQFLQSTVKC